MSRGAPGLAGTRMGLRLAESILSGCAWVVVVGVAALAGGVAGAVGEGSWGLGLAGGGLLVGWLALGAFARARRRRAAPVLEAVAGERALPSVWHPIRVPMSVRTEEGVVRLWRVHGVRKPDGSMVTAEVGIEQETGSPSFVVWGADDERPPAARGMKPVLEPVFGGLLIAAHDPAAVSVRLHGLEAALRAAMPDDGQLAIYPFGIWWRVKGAVSAERLATAEARLLDLATALATRGRG